MIHTTLKRADNGVSGKEKKRKEKNRKIGIQTSSSTVIKHQVNFKLSTRTIKIIEKLQNIHFENELMQGDAVIRDLSHLLRIEIINESSIRLVLISLKSYSGFTSRHANSMATTNMTGTHGSVAYALGKARFCQGNFDILPQHFAHSSSIFCFHFARSLDILLPFCSNARPNLGHM